MTIRFNGKTISEYLAILRALRDHHFTFERIGYCPETGKSLLLRWTIQKTDMLWRMIHKFERSDMDRAVHDHPFDYTTLLLWPGYYEITPSDAVQARILAGEDVRPEDYGPLVRRRYWPLQVLKRPARWAHRIELINSRPSWSLVTRTRKLRDWGFYAEVGWVFWKRFTTDAAICESSRPVPIFGSHQ